jgi:hypothetical protein
MAMQWKQSSNQTEQKHDAPEMLQQNQSKGALM